MKSYHPNPSTFQWLLHSPTEMQIDRADHLVVSYSGNARLFARLLAPQDLEFHQHTGFTPRYGTLPRCAISSI